MLLYFETFFAKVSVIKLNICQNIFPVEPIFSSSSKSSISGFSCLNFSMCSLTCASKMYNELWKYIIVLLKKLNILFIKIKRKLKNA